MSFCAGSRSGCMYTGFMHGASARGSGCCEREKQRKNKRVRAGSTTLRMNTNDAVGQGKFGFGSPCTEMRSARGGDWKRKKEMGSWVEEVLLPLSCRSSSSASFRGLPVSMLLHFVQSFPYSLTHLLTRLHAPPPLRPSRGNHYSCAVSVPCC